MKDNVQRPRPTTVTKGTGLIAKTFRFDAIPTLGSRPVRTDHIKERKGDALSENDGSDKEHGATDRFKFGHRPAQLRNMLGFQWIRHVKLALGKTFNLGL